MAASDKFIEKRAAITGIGQSDIARRLDIDPLEITLDACLAAIADAGLTPGDIDGLSTYPGMAPAGAKGFTGAGAYDVIDALRLNVDWYDSGLETSGQLGSVIKACLAVGAGLATHVVCFRSVWEGSAQGSGGRASIGMGAGAGEGFYASGFMEWTLPFASASAACWIAMYAQAHMHRYGTTTEQLAQIALNARRNAELNPKAIYRTPMTMDDYLAARLITTPLRLFDCDVPCDGATAVVVSRADVANDLRKTPIKVEAVGTALHDRPSWDQLKDLTRLPASDAGAQLWTRTDLTPADVQIAELYDGFSILTMLWLEGLQLCPVGESGPFIEGGSRIAREGQLPVNTHGGQLSAGRLHGYGFLHEACAQLWGEGGDRQVTPAGGAPLEVAAVAAGGGNTCGCMLLTKGR
jgi:acetyl-CoA acetyltransferase